MLTKLTLGAAIVAAAALLTPASAAPLAPAGSKLAVEASDGGLVQQVHWRHRHRHHHHHWWHRHHHHHYWWWYRRHHRHHHHHW